MRAFLFRAWLVTALFGCSAAPSPSANGPVADGQPSDVADAGLDTPSDSYTKVDTTKPDTAANADASDSHDAAALLDSTSGKDTLDAADCTDLTYSCSGHDVLVCADDAWTLLQTCGAAFSCGEGGLCWLTPCKPGFCGTNSSGVQCTCSGAQEVCEQELCVCKPDCAGKVCADDGCGGTCGGCAAGNLCSNGQCVPGSGACGFAAVGPNVATLSFESSAQGVAPGPNGAVVVVGHHELQIAPQQWVYAAFAASYGPLGQPLWNTPLKTLPSLNNSAPATSIVRATNGYVVVSAAAPQAPQTAVSAVLYRLDNLGAVKGTNNYVVETGAASDTYPLSVAILADGGTAMACGVGNAAQYAIHPAFIRTDSAGAVTASDKDLNIKGSYSQVTPIGNDFVLLGADNANAKLLLRRVGSSPFSYVMAPPYPGQPPTGNAGGVQVTGLALDGSGGVLVSYIYASLFQESVLARIDAAGNVVWVEKLGFAHNWGLRALPSGGAVLLMDANATQPFDLSDHLALARVDDQGKLLWQQSFAGLADTQMVPLGLAVDGDGMVVAAGVRWPIPNFASSLAQPYLVRVNGGGTTGCL